MINEQTSVCIVGGGPAGLMLGLLLARRGIDVLVLEGHRDLRTRVSGRSLATQRGALARRARALALYPGPTPLAADGGAGASQRHEHWQF